MHRSNIWVVSTVVFLLALMPASAQDFQLVKLGTHAHGSFDQGGSEIGAYDPATKRAFVVNGSTSSVDVLNIADPAAPSLHSSINLSPRSANSVAAKNGLIAIAVQAATKTDPGTVEFYDAQGNLLKSVGVGAQPDMITFTPNGHFVLTANEGEPNDAYTVDPEGSVSIIDISGGVANATVKTAGFQFVPIDAGVRVFGPNATVAQDLEPEYIAVSPDSTTAWVTIQEANAVGILNISGGFFTRVATLGFKDMNTIGNGFDASDQNSGNINIASWPVKGMYQPDGIALFDFNGINYLVTANEGDVRDWPGFSEVVRLAATSQGAPSYPLDATAFPDAATLRNNNNLGRLNVTRSTGDTDADGDFDAIYTFGGRSFSIWSTNLTQMFDSSDQFEQYLAANTPNTFNVSNTNNTKKNRSDDKGPEPEGLVVYRLGGRTFASIGLERDGGLITYELEGPTSAVRVDYTTNRNFAQTPGLNQGGDLGPEGLLFIPPSQSPNGKAMLMVNNEISATTTLYQVRSINEITDNLRIVVTGLAFNRGQDTYDGVVRFWNRSNETFEGPFYFVPKNVEADLELVNKSGSFQDLPYIEIPIPLLKPGDRGEVRIEFKPGGSGTTPGPGRIDFDAHIFAGSL